MTVVTTVNWANIKLIKIRTANKILSRAPKTPQIAAANTSSGCVVVRVLCNDGEVVGVCHNLGVMLCWLGDVMCV